MNTKFSPTHTKSSFVFLCFFLAFSAMIGQNGWIPGMYSGIPQVDKSAAFFDEFENNSKGWNLNSSYLNMHIKDGDFYCEAKNNQTYVKKRSINYNIRGDYEIEVRMRYVKGSMTGPMGLTFGRDTNGNEYNFYYSPNGKFQILKYARNKNQNLVNWRSSNTLIGAHSFQTLTVRSVDNKWYFFINQQEVYRGEAMPLYGQQVGFTIGGKMAIEVDYLRVSNLRSADVRGPKIVISQPILDINNYVSLSENRQSIHGRVDDASKIKSLTINNHKVVPGVNGEFSATLRLPEGKTKIEVEAVDAHNNKSKKVFYTEYIVEYTPLPPPSPKPSAVRGKTYLLTIGINSYTNWSPLHNAIKDSRDIAHTLISKYQFEERYTYRLFDNEATRENIVETLEKIQHRITEDDNLLIYYAGHGYYDQESKRGYWVPVNARQNKITDYIRNSTIHDYLSGIDSHNTLLIVDACYAGSLFSSSRAVLNETSRSRWAFTSGNIEKVWDGQPGENSPFAKHLINFLDQNTAQKLRADKLVSSVRATVTRNTDQNPLGSPLQNAGDMGGVFVFYRK